MVLEFDVYQSSKVQSLECGTNNARARALDRQKVPDAFIKKQFQCLEAEQLLTHLITPCDPLHALILQQASFLVILGTETKP